MDLDGMRRRMADTANTMGNGMNRASGIMTLKRGIVLAFCAIFLALSFQLFEYCDAADNVVIQWPDGSLHWTTSGGPALQLFGNVTRYPKSEQYWFSAAKDQGAKDDNSIKTRFNDGGGARVSGGMRFDYPADEKHLTAMHIKYRSHENVERALIRPWLERVVWQSGPTMSSAESYASRSAEFPGIIEDQAQNGLYKTETKEEKTKDVLSGQEKTVKVAYIVKDDNAPNGRARTETAPTSEYGIKLHAFSVNGVFYDQEVLNQIQAQQKIAMEIQTSIAEAKKAEQNAITAKANGEAEAAKAKWEQEAIKAKMVTEAQQNLEVAEKENLQATQVMEKLIKEGKGEAEKRRLIMQADNALQAKLDALVKIATANANAIANVKGNLVPQVVMGGTSGAGMNITDMLNVMLMQNAKMLNLNFGAAAADRK